MNSVEDVLKHWAIRGLYSVSRTLMPFETKVNYNDPLSRVLVVLSTENRR